MIEKYENKAKNFMRYGTNIRDVEGPGGCSAGSSNTV